MNGIRFGEVHSFEDLNLILSKVDLPPAAVKTVYVENPGGDGSWDLTEANGKVNYKNRTAKFTFSVLPEDDFEAKKTEVSNLLNGRRFKITLDKDPEYYWDGRCTVDQYSSNKKMRQIVVGASVAPYKLKQEKTRVFVPFCGKNFASNNVNDWETLFNVSISNNVMTGQNVGGASNYTYLKTLLPRGTFVASGEFQGLVRFLVKLFDDNGKILTNNDILGFGAFNSYYKGFYFSEAPKVLRIPNKAAYWQFGVVFTDTGEATNLTITNLQLELGEAATDYVPYVSKAPQGKNLIRFPYDSGSSYSYNGITFNANEDGSVTINGTSTGFAGFVLAANDSEDKPFAFLENGTAYFLSGAGSRKADLAIYFSYNDETGATKYYGSDTLDPLVWLDSYSNHRIYIQVNKTGSTFENYKVYPQFEKGTAPTAYEPYTTDAKFTLSNGRKTVSPTIICTGETNLKVGGNEFILSEGTHKVLDFSISEGETAVTLNGSGAAAIVYQEGDL